MKTAQIKPLNKKQIAAKIKEVIANGKWMLRRNGEDGKSYNGFQWQPLGVWTEAPDFNKKKCMAVGYMETVPSLPDIGQVASV
jgi:hypothetical protein